MSLKDHQVRALSDLYVRGRHRLGEVQSFFLNPPLNNEGAVSTWDWERRKAEAACGTLWQMPCRSGKTRTALSALYHWTTWLREWGIVPDLQRRWAAPHLVLVPSDLVRDEVWPKDWGAVAPPWENGVGIYPIPTLDYLPLRQLLPGDVAVISYHTLLHRQDQIAAHPWQVIVADEVHRLKNPSAAWTQASYRLQSTFRIGMSATPFTNYVHELRDVLAWLQGWTVGNRRMSHIWPNWRHWRENWCRWRYIPTKNGHRKVPAGAMYPEYLYNKLRAEVLFSATKDEVSDAPDPIIHPLPVPLSAKQAEVYDDLKRGVLEWMSSNGEVQAVDTGPVIAQFGYLFQLCADAQQLELSIMHKGGDNILPHTRVRPTFSKGWARADQSSKLKALLWILDKVADDGEQVLVLTGYARLAHILTRDLQRLGYSAEAITGDTKDRSGVVSRFGRQETRVVICTKAAWEGISLRAPFAVLYGFVDHTPGLVKQALLRAWNMFDTIPVTVYDIYAPGTVEEWNRERLAAKDRYAGMMTNGQDRATFSSVADIGAALNGKFTP
jgi:SNF2 family DNA or RNA helicase